MKSENSRKNNIFSKINTKHGMDLRKYEENGSKKTNRLENSSIPYMQRILNSEFEKQILKRKIKFHGVKNIEKKIRLN